MARIGIADTTFARHDLGKVVRKTLSENGEGVDTVTYTVPGVKDLPVACKKLIEEHNCEIVLALGMPGHKPIDRQCAHEASSGIIMAQLMTNRHILEVFVHEDEAKTEGELARIAEDRARKHALNALALAKSKDALGSRAGTGRRQGHGDAGPLREER